MADEPDVKAPEGGGGLKATLMKKVGPIPLVAWIAIAAVIVWYTRKKTSTGSGGEQTDPAGNVGTINPATGYVTGSAEDIAAGGGSGSLSGSLGSSTDSGTGGSTVGGTYADNNAWAVAAINYLVSIGVDATAANTAITQFLGSQQLTTAQQADVNLAIQRLGAPPSPPEPGGSNTPIVNPPSSSTYATNPPTGFTTTSVGTSSIGVKWNATTNAVSYTVSWGTSANASDGTTTVTTPAATITGLKANTLYYVRVQANPAKTGSAFASLTKTTAKSTTTTPSKPSTPAKPAPKTPIAHKVTKDGESYSSIAKAEGYKGTGTALYQYNITSSPHSAAAKAKLKKQGPNLLLHGQTVYVPRS